MTSVGAGIHARRRPVGAQTLLASPSRLGANPARSAHAALCDADAVAVADRRAIAVVVGAGHCPAHRLGLWRLLVGAGDGGEKRDRDRSPHAPIVNQHCT
jgi:hypothetical protein